jgi:hypothetical protein
VSSERKFETAHSYDDRCWTHRAGLDAHLGLNSYSQLDLTLRPDFGQVEVDQAVLNLGTVETYFPEKRPFFLEGMEIFQLPGVRLFYSRRIGTGLPGPDPALDVVDWPKAAEITGAAKYTAKLPGGLAIGLLGAGIATATGTLREGTAEDAHPILSPYTNAAVARVTQALDERGSYLGGFGSFLRQTGSTGRTAGVTALDGAWKSPDRSLTVEGVYAHSEAGPKGTTLGGDLLRVHTTSALGKGWRIDGNAFTVSNDFNPNDLGYLDRPDRKGYTFDLDKNWDLVKGAFRNPMWRFTYCDFRDQAGKPYLQYVESYLQTEFTSDWSAVFGHGRMAVVYADRELRTFRDPVKKYLRLPSMAWTFVGFSSPPNLPYSVSAQVNQVPREGGIKHEVQFSQVYKPSPRIEARLETMYTYVHGEWHWLETQGTTPIVGMRRLSQLDQAVRLSYAYSPSLTFQVFSQWLAGNWRFTDLRRYVDDFTLAPGATSDSPLATSDRLWNVNLITRWEFRPGSSLFVVYTHGAWTGDLVNDRGTLSPRRDLALMKGLPSDDAVQVKLSWMFR